MGYEFYEQKLSDENYIHITVSNGFCSYLASLIKSCSSMYLIVTSTVPTDKPNPFEYPKLQQLFGGETKDICTNHIYHINKYINEHTTESSMFFINKNEGCISFQIFHITAPDKFGIILPDKPELIKMNLENYYLLNPNEKQYIDISELGENEQRDKFYLWFGNKKLH
jgi:hypothetical protein